MDHTAAISRTSSENIRIGTTVRYHWRDGDGLATVVERTDDTIRFDGPDCDGCFSPEQVDNLIEAGRLQVVLDDELHADVPRWAEQERP